MEINDLPPEILVKIFQYITQEELLNVVCHVSGHWDYLTKSGGLWKCVDLNRLFIQHTDGDNLLSKLSTVSPTIQKLTASPDRLRILLNNGQIKLDNLWKLDIGPSSLTSHDVIEMVRKKCPSLTVLSFKTFIGVLPVLKHVFCDLNLNQISISHEKFEKDAILKPNDDDRLISFLKDNAPTIVNMNAIQIKSFSHVFIWFILEITQSNITSLNAFGDEIDSNIVLKLTDRAVKLTELRLDFSNVCDKGMLKIAEELPNLKLLSLQCCKHITDKGIETVTKSCRKLEQLFLRNSLNDFQWTLPASDISLLAVSDGCSSLTNFSIQNTRVIDDVILSKFTRNCRLLVSLNLNRCTPLSDLSLDIIAQNCRLLQKADFSECMQISINGIWTVLSKCEVLTSLSLSACKGINRFLPPGANPSAPPTVQEVLDEISAVKESKDAKDVLKPSRIQTINLSFCENLDETTVLWISEKCLCLRNLILRLSIESVQEIILRRLFSNCYYLKRTLIGVGRIIERKDFVDD